MKKLRSAWSGLSFRIIVGSVGILLLFGTVVGYIGYIRFTDSMTAEYNDSAFRTAETAVRLIDGDRIDAWQKSGGGDEDYRQTAGHLDTL